VATTPNYTAGNDDVFLFVMVLPDKIKELILFIFSPFRKEEGGSAKKKHNLLYAHTRRWPMQTLSKLLKGNVYVCIPCR